jgi:hypothetical protein
MATEEQIIDALSEIVEISQDRSLIGLGGHAYRATKAEIDSVIARDSTVEVAMPGMIVRPDVRTDCFFVATESQIVVAWSKGRFKKKVETQAVQRSEVTSVDVVAGNGSMRRAKFLTLSGAFGEIRVAIDPRTTSLHSWLESKLAPTGQ